MKPASPYLTTQEAADYLRCPTVKQFYDLRYRLKKAGTPLQGYRRGGRKFFKQVDLDRAMEQEPAGALQLARQRSA